MGPLTHNKSKPIVISKYSNNLLYLYMEKYSTFRRNELEENLKFYGAVYTIASI